MPTASDIFDHHLAAFGAGDIEDIVSDYTEHSVMIYGDNVWRGLDGARAFFAMWLDQLLPAGSRFDVIDRLVDDDVVYLTWTAESQAYRFEFGTDTFVMRDGKVFRQTVATLHHRK